MNLSQNKLSLCVCVCVCPKAYRTSTFNQILQLIVYGIIKSINQSNSY